MKIKIDKYSAAPTKDEFLKILNQDTEKIKKSLPSKAQKWGAARKVINIFLRNLAYNKYICKKYKLDRMEKWLEVPLDRYVATGLRNTKLGKNLPSWPGIKNLQKGEKQNSDYQQYQAVAQSIAEKKRINRIDLDIIFWRKLCDAYLEGI